jgi:hypothetical protein
VKILLEPFECQYLAHKDGSAKPDPCGNAQEITAKYFGFEADGR